MRFDLSNKGYKKAFLGILMVFPLASCVKQGMAPAISPSQSRTDVPVNAVIHLEYIGDEYIHENELNKSENFELGVCSQSNVDQPSEDNKDETLVDSNQNSEKTEDSSNKKKQEQAPSVSNVASSINHYVVWKRSEHLFDDGPFKVTDVFIIPISGSSNNPPLPPNSDICFEVDQMIMEGEDRKLTQAGSTSFQTEERSVFGFSQNAIMTMYKTRPAEKKMISSSSKNQKSKPKPQKLMVLVEFSHAVHPNDVYKGAFRCISKQTQNDDTPCGVDFVPDSRRIFFVQDFQVNEKLGLILSAFNLYAITGPKLDPKVDKYVVKVELDDDVPSIEFSAGDLDEIANFKHWSDPLTKKPQYPIFVRVRSAS